MNSNQNGQTTVLDKPEQIEAYVILSLRQALLLQTKGLKMSRGQSALSIARARGLTTKRTAAGALEDVNQYIADNYNL